MLLNAKSFLRQLRWAGQRAIRGWSDNWVWNIDFTLESLVGDLVLRLAQSTSGYPDSKFGSYKEWIQELRYLAYLFKKINYYERRGEYTKAELIRNKAWSKFMELRTYLWD